MLQPLLSAQIKFFFYSLFLSAIFTPLVIFFAKKFGKVAPPRQDRWHQVPTALFGGVAIYLAFALSYIPIFETVTRDQWLLLLGGTLFFVIGFVDDLLEFTPQGKFIAQLVAVVTMTGLGFKMHLPGYPLLSMGVTIFWLIVIVNALNILDNMDGLSSGISMIAAISLAIYGTFWDKPEVSVPAMSLAGACLGFFLFNFKPAKIFMGDCGSLFLGFCLGGLAIMSSKLSSSPTGAYLGLSNLILMLAVPISALIIPIFDCLLVSVMRLITGRSIAKGGKDHTSHRMVRLGMSEERTVITLMAITALVSGLTLYMAKHSMDGLIALFSITVIFAIFFGVFLSYLNSDIYEKSYPESRVALILRNILNKKQILQVCIDLVLLTISYFCAYLLKFDGRIDVGNMQLIAKSLPLVLGVKICCMWFFGLYRGQWRFASLDDTFKIIKATVVSSSIIVGVLVFLYRFQGYSRIVFFLDALMTFLLVGGVRFILRMFNEYFIRQAEKKHSIPILLYGAGEGGDLFLRELRKRKGHDYLPVGFIDDDKAKLGQEIHGVKVLGTGKDIENIIKRHGIKILFISILSQPLAFFDDIREVCQRHNVKCVRMRPLVSFDELSTKDAASLQGKVLPLGKKKKKRFVKGG